jgi:hypothetical protein
VELEALSCIPIFKADAKRIEAAGEMRETKGFSRIVDKPWVWRCVSIEDPSLFINEKRHLFKKIMQL